MSNRNRPGIPPSQQSYGPRRVHGVGPWQPKARDAVEMIVALERHTHPEMNEDAIAARVIGHAKKALDLDPDERFQTMADIDREADTNAEGVMLAGPPGIFRIVIDYAGISPGDEIAAESFIAFIQSALKRLPKKLKFKVRRVRDPRNPHAAPMAQLIHRDHVKQ